MIVHDSMIVSQYNQNPLNNPNEYNPNEYYPNISSKSEHQYGFVWK